VAERRVFPADWLSGSAEEPATDLDLVVLLLNSVDLLEPEPDRLTDLTWFRTALRQAGHAPLADAVADGDLGGLRRLRDSLRLVFESDDPEAAAQHLNELLLRARALPLVVADGDGLRLEVAPGRTGYDALAARLPAAVATHIAAHGLATLGVCDSDPCRCAFVDRTRAGTRRYCCGWCNDRRAARAYRRRRAAGPGQPPGRGRARSDP
jgi:predicted RNA-binding Zn ribbon-like protein